jgi:tetratricopeptide (TPR) repeat protein
MNFSPPTKRIIYWDNNLTTLRYLFVICLCLSVGHTYAQGAERQRTDSTTEERIITDAYSTDDPSKAYANRAAVLIDYALDSVSDSVKRSQLWRQSISLIDTAIALDHYAIISYYNKALAYFHLRKADSSLPYLDMLRQLYGGYPLLPELYFNTGVTFYMQNRYPEAARAFNIALALRPDNEPTLNAIAVLKKQKQYNEKAIARLPRYYRKVAIDTTNPKYYNSRANAKDHFGDHEGALADYSRAIALAPGFELYYYERAWQEDQLGELQPAIDDLDKAISLTPSFKAAYWLRGKTYMDMGRNKEAIQDLTEAIDMDEHFANAYYKRGMARIATGDREGGCRDLTKAHDLGDADAATAIATQCGR